MPVTKLKPKSTIAAELMKVYNDSLDTFLVSKGDIGRIKSLRPSQLPFCPLNFFCHHATFGALRTMEMTGAFYVTIGTAVHEVLQNYMGKSGRFLANWHCKQCGKQRKVSMQNECCDFPCTYHEIEIRYKGVVGHIDAVFRDRHGNYWIVDFKTTSLAAAKTKLKKPGVAYTEQVEAYALMLWLEHGIKVKGVVLMFVKRDNPKEPVIWEKELGDLDFTSIKKRMAKYKKMHREVLAVETMKEALALAAYGKCKNPWCKSCRSRVKAKDQIKKAFALGQRASRFPLKDLN